MRKVLLLVAALLLSAAAHAQFDHDYAAWDALLSRHVRWLPDQKQTRVDYDGFKTDRAALRDVLAAMSAVERAEFDRWRRDRQMAFLVNAYNAFTIDLVLTRWPDLTSIKDLGSLWRSPWKKEFFALLGEPRHLDWIEHEMLRPRYRDPRVHAAVNCASVGCPALRPEAFTAARLEVQLEDGMMRFLADRTRNRVGRGVLQVSMIFKWFREDFEQGQTGVARLEDFFARYADSLGDRPDERRRLRERDLPVTFLDYDWSLNALGR